MSEVVCMFNSRLEAGSELQVNSLSVLTTVDCLASAAYCGHAGGIFLDYSTTMRGQHMAD